MFTPNWQINLGSYTHQVNTVLAELKKNRVIERIWSKDYTVWKPDPAEISNRMGWLECPLNMNENINRMKRLADELRADEFTHALLLGMGGSSLAPEVLRTTFGVSEGPLDLEVLDSTDPAYVLYHANRLDPEKTLFVVSTKSGTTVETFSFFKYFFNRTCDVLGADRAGKHFVAITDPGSSLTDLADRHSFRATFLNNPDIGGRYSALSYFGLLPATFIGLDVGKLLECSMEMAEHCRNSNSGNAGLSLGVMMGTLAKAGRDKLTLIISPEIGSFGNWLEQLIAESTGKKGRGILPVVGEPAGSPDMYGNDRFFVSLNLEWEGAYGTALKALEDAGHPVVNIQLKDLYDLGGQFFLWEMATAVAAHILQVNPFDQPDVEMAKKLSRRMVDDYVKRGTLPSETPTLCYEGITVYGGPKARTPGEVLAAFIEQAAPGSYVALQAYIQPRDKTDNALKKLRVRIRDRYNLATTIGYGPRFLHSTGQLHKGDSGKGLFIQLTADDVTDAPIPDNLESSASSMSFGVLKMVQAMGDRQALFNAGRQVVRFHLGQDISGGIKHLTGLKGSGLDS
jgi:glucose-6-phosphate isomerase